MLAVWPTCDDGLPAHRRDTSAVQSCAGHSGNGVTFWFWITLPQ